MSMGASATPEIVSVSELLRATLPQRMHEPADTNTWLYRGQARGPSALIASAGRIPGLAGEPDADLTVFRPWRLDEALSEQPADGALFVFHYHPDPRLPLEDQCPGQLTGYRIPHAAKPDLRKELDRLGIDYELLFPDLEGFSQHLNWLAHVHRPT